MDPASRYCEYPADFYGHQGQMDMQAGHDVGAREGSVRSLRPEWGLYSYTICCSVVVFTHHS